MSDYPVQSVIDISGAKYVSPNKEYVDQEKYLRAQRCCSTCGALLSGLNHDCSMRYCLTCKQNRATVHQCYTRTLKVFYRLTRIMCCKYSMNLRPLKTRFILTLQKNMCLTSSACETFVRDVRKSKTVVSIVIVAAGEGTHFGMILYGICSLICVNP